MCPLRSREWICTAASPPSAATRTPRTRYGEAPKSVLALLDVALLRAAAARSGVADISQRKDVLKFTLGVFRPEALVTVCGLHKYKGRLTIAAGDTPALTLKLSPGADVLETARTLVEDLRLAGGES